MTPETLRANGDGQETNVWRQAAKVHWIPSAIGYEIAYLVNAKVFARPPQEIGWAWFGTWIAKALIAIAVMLSTNVVWHRWIRPDD